MTRRRGKPPPPAANLCLPCAVGLLHCTAARACGVCIGGAREPGAKQHGEHGEAMRPRAVARVPVVVMEVMVLVVVVVACLRAQSAAAAAAVAHVPMHPRCAEHFYRKGAFVAVRRGRHVH